MAQRKLSFEEIMEALKELPQEERKNAVRELNALSKAERAVKQAEKQALLREGREKLGEDLECVLDGQRIRMSPRKFANSGRYGWNFAGRLLVKGYVCQVSLNVVILE